MRLSDITTEIEAITLGYKKLETNYSKDKQLKITVYYLRSIDDYVVFLKYNDVYIAVYSMDTKQDYFRFIAKYPVYRIIKLKRELV